MKGELLTVAISGVEPGEVAQSGFGIARGLRRVFGNRTRIVALSRSAWQTAAGVERDFDGGWGIGRGLDAQAHLDQIKEVDARFGLDVLIPSRTPEATALLSQREALRESRIAAVVPSLAAWQRAVNPGQRSSRETGIRPLESMGVTDVANTVAAVRVLGLPVVVKSARHCEVVHSLDAVLAASERLWSAGSVVALQKHIAGDEYDVAVVRDGVSGHCVSLTLRKTLVTRFGQVWAGVTTADKDVRELALRATAAFDWHGPCELDVVKDRRGTFWLREFAPRLPSWHELGIAAGVNLSLALFYVAVGRRLRVSSSGGSGIYYAHRATDLIGEMSQGAAVRAARGAVLRRVGSPDAAPIDAAPLGNVNPNSLAQGLVGAVKPRVDVPLAASVV